MCTCIGMLNILQVDTLAYPVTHDRMKTNIMYLNTSPIIRDS